jgi:hypothetical protein
MSDWYFVIVIRFRTENPYVAVVESSNAGAIRLYRGLAKKNPAAYQLVTGRPTGENPWKARIAVADNEIPPSSPLTTCCTRDGWSCQRTKRADCCR